MRLTVLLIMLYLLKILGPKRNLFLLSKPTCHIPFLLINIFLLSGYDNYQEPYYVAPMAGSFEVTPSADPENKYLRQMTILPPVDWCEKENFTLSLLGNVSWLVIVYCLQFVHAI